MLFLFSLISPERPEVSPLPIENDLTWHDINYQMSHWPVDKQPYLNAVMGIMISQRLPGRHRSLILH
mgnify:CR=1 FL=1